MSGRNNVKSNRDDVILQAVKALKTSEFKATGIKVELEAQFNRGNEGCGDCDGSGFFDCGECDGRGTFGCRGCDSSGIQDCEQNGCTEPAPLHEHECDDCNGGGEVGCDYCEDGRRDCGYCDGESNGDESIIHCYNFLMEKLSHHNLAEQVDGAWKPKHPLVFAKFYNDGSVDSELTFTLSLDKAENIFLLPKFIDAWKQLAVELDCEEIDVEGSGMHMALINDPNCVYNRHAGIPTAQIRRYENFKKSMSLLLPTLYFLGASNENSRGLSYRRPQIRREEKYSAIFYVGGTLEFRLFDTCYDNPAQILDNVVVMSKCMRYWTSKYKPSGVNKQLRELRFGLDGGRKLERLYQTVEHIDVLNVGLAKLKPDYYTVRELKEQRKFKTTKRTVQTMVNKKRKEAEVGYQEYKERFEWNIQVSEFDGIAQALRDRNRPNETDRENIIEEVTREVKTKLKKYREDNTKPLDTYTQEVVDEYIRNRRGQYLLSEAA